MGVPPLFTATKATLYVYEVSSNDVRRQIHNYIRKHHPELFSISLTCEVFPTEKDLMRVHDCEDDEESLIKMTYSSPPDWRDDCGAYHGYCTSCGCSPMFEPRYDDLGDHTFYMVRGNCVVVGTKEAFKAYTAKTTKLQDIPTYEEMKEILTVTSTYKVCSPKSTQNKTWLAIYVSEQISKTK